MLETIDRIERPNKLTETITAKLRALIEQGMLKPGDRLPSEKELCEAFGVGRSSVREALQALAHLGLIRSRQGIGRFLSEDARSYVEAVNWGKVFEQAPIFHLMEARECLEVRVARLAAQRASDEAISGLERILADVKDGGANDADKFFGAELEFHEALSQATGNQVLAEMVRMVVRRVHGEAERFLRTVPHTSQETARLFEALLSAIKDGDSERAGELMEQHLGTVNTVLKELSSKE